MPETPQNRIYSEEEIGRILKRAADLQGRQTTRPVLGLTLPELQQLARESDIDPAFIEAAALELAGADRPDEAGFFGGPLTLTIRRRIDGRVSEDGFGRMVSEARRRFKKAGVTGSVGSTREWSTENEADASGSFSLRERDGYTELEIFWTESRILPIPFLSIPMAIMVMSLPLWIEGVELTGVPLAFAIAATLFVLATASRTLFRSTTARHRRQVRDLADVLVEIAHQERLRETPAATRAAAPAAETGPRIAPDEQEAAPRIPLDEPETPDTEAPDRDTRTRER